MRSVLALTVSCVVLLVSCGNPPGVATGSASPSETVVTFMHALGDKDAEAACYQISTGGAPLKGAGLNQCREGLQKVLADLDDPGDVAKLKSTTVTGASVSGDRATITKDQIANVPAGFENDIDLVRIDGRWYIDSKQ